MKILLAGVPFGRNNIGDEAILEGMVTMLRSIEPAVEICVSTDMQKETRDVLNVETCPLLGFSHVDYSREEAESIIQQQDLFIWSGATGLSDYPDDAMTLVSICRKVNTPVVIFGTGMNSELNPAKFQLQAGRKKDLFRKLSQLTFGTVDFSYIYEKRKLATMLATMKANLAYPRLIALRNEDSQQNLKTHCPGIKSQLGVDLALVLDSDESVFERLDKHTQELLGQDRKKIGLCISAQRQLNNLDEFAARVDEWIVKYEANVFLIAMNPITDAALMETIRKQLRNKQNCTLVKACLQPREVVALSARMDTVISSRLHLLILASINHVPLIGISRGSKVDTFLKRFGLQSCGSVEAVDLAKIDTELKKFFNNPLEFKLKSKKVRAQMLNNQKVALDMLHHVLHEIKENIHACTA
ncbi:polysaccharide pyruvyl transferase family protein [Lentisphaera profundi]|uniref:Polysaccharide pyruvyl transferase family protein n=1 Tax=Lentisphaera profundi TaxID=1658616 RepID=A0ABY7W0P5_9BACT|nr:polysaccharide pyruvyl transferase family protein [Lentisphaera profundi]WDE98559.1 polysaccharide pyruvyl transferase family protein [Lentisphaera profundi]